MPRKKKDQATAERKGNKRRLFLAEKLQQLGDELIAKQYLTRRKNKIRPKRLRDENRTFLSDVKQKEKIKKNIPVDTEMDEKEDNINPKEELKDADQYRNGSDNEIKVDDGNKMTYQLQYKSKIENFDNKTDNAEDEETESEEETEVEDCTEEKNEINSCTDSEREINQDIENEKYENGTESKHIDTEMYETESNSDQEKEHDKSSDSDMEKNKEYEKCEKGNQRHDNNREDEYELETDLDEEKENDKCTDTASDSKMNQKK
ncbi:clumping factor A-like [Mercenaria mercenaria]|uniref:clumping factor A-like n=1 Tax=Mercenaria mercenaria TaxID=6596 RepID=UPI00234EDDDB|nr:clumping factor A-like [Mercenaria mercenaria]